MKIIKTKLPVKINLFGILITHDTDDLTISHETIHAAQKKEMLYILFYVWMLLEWLIKLIRYRDCRKAYRALGFEREAFTYQCYKDYLSYREPFKWVDLISEAS